MTNVSEGVTSLVLVSSHMRGDMTMTDHVIPPWIGNKSVPVMLPPDFLKLVRRLDALGDGRHALTVDKAEGRVVNWSVSSNEIERP